MRVASSPAGEAQASFVLPFTDKDLTIFVLGIIGSIGRVRRNVRRIGSLERRLIEDFGGQLFQAVFSGPVRDALGRSLIAADNENAGLRIRLRLPGELANIPWEYLYDPEYGFLGLSPETALVRYVEMPIPARPFPVSPPLRILAMISAPSDLPGLDGHEEWNKLNGALDDLISRGMVQVDRLEAGTLGGLQRPLRLNEYHVLHFIGHGAYDEHAQDGALALEGADGKVRLVTGRDLGQIIRGHRSMRLVVLNACEGARSAKDDPFGGVAQALVRQGIPSVIAMQFEISDPAALIFSQSFYQAIADGLPVDLAMVEARRTMFAEGHEVEWATPVLYLRSPDGRVFSEAATTQAKRKAREEAEREAREEAERITRQKPHPEQPASRDPTPVTNESQAVKDEPSAENLSGPPRVANQRELEMIAANLAEIIYRPQGIQASFNDFVYKLDLSGNLEPSARAQWDDNLTISATNLVRWANSRGRRVLGRLIAQIVEEAPGRDDAAELVRIADECGLINPDRLASLRRMIDEDMELL